MEIHCLQVNRVGLREPDCRKIGTSASNSPPLNETADLYSRPVDKPVGPPRFAKKSHTSSDKGGGGIAMFKNATEAERAERDQHADYARIDAAINSAKTNIAAVESRQLSPDERRKEWSRYSRPHNSRHSQCTSQRNQARNRGQRDRKLDGSEIACAK